MEIFYGHQFRNVKSKVVVRATMKPMRLTDWIKSQSDYQIYINNMWIEGDELQFKAEAAIAPHVKGWLGQLVTRARVLLTDISYNIVITEDLQSQMNTEFHNTMLLQNSIEQTDLSELLDMEIDTKAKSAENKVDHGNQSKKYTTKSDDDGSRDKNSSQESFETKAIQKC